MKTSLSLQHNTANQTPGRAGVTTSLRPGFFFVPIHLALQALNDSTAPLLETLVAMRSTRGGCVVPDHAALARVLHCHPKTVKRRLARMESRGMIRVDQTTGKVYPISLRTGARFRFEGTTPENFRHTLVLALLSKWNKSIRCALKLMKKTKLSTQAAHSGGIAASTIAMKCGKSKAWALSQEKQLERLRLLQIRRRVRVVDDVPPDALRYLRSHEPDAVRGLVIHNGEVIERLASVLTPRIDVGIHSQLRWKR